MKIDLKFSKKKMFFENAPERWSEVLFLEKTCFHGQKHIFRYKNV